MHALLNKFAIALLPLVEGFTQGAIGYGAIQPWLGAQSYQRAIARPGELLRMGHHPGAHRVEINVASHLEKMVVGGDGA